MSAVKFYQRQRSADSNQIPTPAIMSSVTPNDPPHLHNLLSKFGVERLGEGDVGAGANLLAAMACSLANLQRPGSGLVNGDGETLAVGTSLLVSGARSVSLISEKVLAGLATRQNNLVSHLTQKAESDEEEAKKSRLSMSVSPGDLMADMRASMLETLYQPFSGMGPEGSAGSWSQLVETPPLPGDRTVFTGRNFRSFKTYFECIDPNKGIVVGWREDTLKKPKCYQ